MAMRHFQHQSAVADLCGQRIVDIGQFTFELHIDYGAQNLCDATDRITRHFGILLCAPLVWPFGNSQSSAATPERIPNQEPHDQIRY
jgi:hypothetical protein